MGKIFNKYECSSNRKARRKLNKIIDEILKGRKPDGNQLIYAKSPRLFKEIGVPDFELLMSPNEIAKAVLSKKIAKRLKYPIGKNDDYHNLGKRLFNKVLDNLLNPVLIIEEKENKIIVFSEYFDYKNRQIIVPIEIYRESSNYSKYNAILSTHGRSSIKRYLEKLIQNGSKFIYFNNKKIQMLNDKVQYPTTITSVSNINITHKK